MASEDYELGRVDERVAVDALLNNANVMLEILVESGFGDPAMSRLATAARDAIERYRQQTNVLVEAATTAGWYPR